MLVREVINYLHSIAPNNLQEDYDNSGLLVGEYDSIVSSILVTLDITESVIEEAVALGANMIVAHHPIIFSGLRRLTDANYVQRIVKSAIKKDIHLFSIHTNLDNVHTNGVNGMIAKKLGITNTAILRPKEKTDHNGEPVGSGLIGTIDSMEENQFLAHLKTKMELRCIKYTALLNQPIKKVAICGGSGRFLLDDAISQGADVFVSSDFKYHEYFDADNKIIIADIGHFESEKYTRELLFEILTEKFNTFATHCSKVDTNPVNYLF